MKRFIVITLVFSLMFIIKASAQEKDALGASDEELQRLIQINFTGKIVEFPDNELRKLMEGKWTTGRHDYEYLSDGTWQMLPKETSTTKGTWRIENRQLIEGSGSRTILEASQVQIVLKNSNGTYPYRYVRIGQSPVASPSTSIKTRPPLDPSYINNISQKFGVWNQEKGAYHTGIDISTSEVNPPVYAISDGIVVLNFTNTEKYPDDDEKYYNSFLIVKHPGFFAYYGHINSSLEINTKVKIGEIIGTIRDAYQSKSINRRKNHLHISITKGSDWLANQWGYKKLESDVRLFVDPTNYIKENSNGNQTGYEGASGQPTITTEIPAKFHGTWTPNKSGTYSSGESPTKISAKKWSGHESQGDVVEVKINNNNEIIVGLKVSAEGEEYIEKRGIRISTDGNVLSLFNGDNAMGKIVSMLYRAGSNEAPAPPKHPSGECVKTDDGTGWVLTVPSGEQFVSKIIENSLLRKICG